MKILFFSNYSKMYGANHSLVGLISDIQRRYSAQCVVLAIGKGNLFDVLKSKGIESYRSIWLPWRMNKRRDKAIYRIIVSLLNALLFYPVNLVIASFIKPDIIHINSSVTDIGVYIAKRLQIPCVWHLREYGELDYDLVYMKNKDRINKTFSEADCIIAVSNSIKSYYQEIIPQKPIRMIYNGVSMDGCIRNRETYSSLKICCVGLISEKKNQLDILKALHVLDKKGYNDYRLYIIGAEIYGGYMDVLNDFILVNGLNGKVHFLGYKENVDEYLSEMDIGVITSKYEAFGRVAVEYMLSSMPVVSTSTGGSAELVDDGVNGFLYKPGDYEKLGELIIRFMENRYLVDKMGEEGRNKALRFFSQQRCTDEVYKIYEELTGGEK